MKVHLSVRDELPGDLLRREAILDAAMGPDRLKKSSENLRRGRVPAKGLAFSLEVQGTLAGTLRLWEVDAGGTAALLLGPLAVIPDMAGMGGGSLLVTHALAVASRLGHGAVILVGDPGYYTRFGFQARTAGGLSMPGPFERRRLLAVNLVEGWLDRASGTIKPAPRRSPDLVLAA